MNYYLENQLVIKLHDYKCKALFFSNQTTLGSLKSFKFFNDNKNTTDYITETFRNVIIEKTYAWFNTTNLIYYDAFEHI